MKFKGIGIFSSPRITDLNGDGVGDVVIGAGRTEFHGCDSAVIAMNGVNGKILWTVPASDHIFGSAAFKDLNGDKVDDILIGGRSAEFLAINGKNGKVIWRFNTKQGDVKWFNFYNAQFIRDQDKDGFEDILVSNGGNVLADAFEEKERKPGNLAVINGKNGKLIARAPMPDGKETYMSPVILPIEGSNDYRILIGSGGETIGGHLYVTTLSDVLGGSMANARILDASAGKGYIGPPIWADINNDKVFDIVANAVEGKLIAIDGKTYETLWTVRIPKTEAYSSVAPGYFTGGDRIPDFFVSYAVGTWPDFGWSKQCMVNGATGKVAYLDSLGSYQTSTPVVLDVNNDGVDEAILNVNSEVVDIMNNPSFSNILVVVDFKANDFYQVGEPYQGSNLASTPWIGDLDHDGLLDVIYCHGTNPRKTYSFDGIQVNRLSSPIKLTSGVIRWGGYMGTNHNGVFDNR